MFDFSAQAQGLLCEEQGNFVDNVKYCGYCAYHYKKLVSSHRLISKVFNTFNFHLGDLCK